MVSNIVKESFSCAVALVDRHKLSDGTKGVELFKAGIRYVSYLGCLHMFAPLCICADDTR